MRLQAFLREVAAPGREVTAIPPFTAYLDGDDPLRYLNYAIPDGDVDPSADEIERLRAAFRERERLPRLEWIEEAAPRLSPALEAAGMREELRAPMMACAQDGLVVPSVDGATVAAVTSANLRATADIQRVAFGGQPLADDEEPAVPRGGAVLARIGGQAVSAGQWTAVVDGYSEIVGIATADAWRGRGLAGLVTAAAAQAAFEAGASMCVLSPGNDTAQRVYARAGFRRIATMLHYSDPG